MKKILFVCSGNIARSVIAEYILKNILIEKNLSDKISVSSRGILGSAGTTPPRFSNLSKYDKEYPIALPALESIAIDITKHISTPIDIQSVLDADIVIAMDFHVLSGASNSLHTQFPEHSSKIKLFMSLSHNDSDVIDPDGKKDISRYEKIVKDVDSVLRSNFTELLNWINYSS